jgi:predicted Zn-dependent protease
LSPRLSPSYDALGSPPRAFAAKEAAVRIALLTAAVLILVPSLVAEPPTKEQIARWIKELGDDSFATREQASKRLWEAGQSAEAAIREAVKSPDVEVARRARALLDKFKWGLYPDTPPQVAAFIQRYRGADFGGKQAVIKELFDLGAPGCTALLKIANAEEDATMRPQLFHQLGFEATRAMPHLLMENDFATLERLLELSLAANQDAAVPNFAALAFMQRKLDAKIVDYKTRTERDDNKRAAEVLAYLYRAKGDAALARQAAAKAGRKELEEAIVFEAADWTALAQFDLSGGSRRPLEALGCKAAYCRLSGNATEFEKAIQQIRAYRDKKVENDFDTWLAAKALFLNDRPQDALVLLANKRSAAFEILCAQMRFGEAFALVEQSKTEPGGELPLLEILQARTLHQLGEKEKAAKILAALGEQIKEGNDASWYAKLIEVEYRLGLKEQAFDHCARVLAVTKAAGRTASMLEKVFPGRGETASAWWKVLYRQAPKDAPVGVMNRLREVLSGNDKYLQFIDLSKPMAIVQSQVPLEEMHQWALAVLDVALASNPDDEARSRLDYVLPLAHSAAGQIRYADYWIAQKKWDRAAESFAQSWKLDPKEPLPLFLQGWALVQAGRDKEGKRLMELAHWLPLGNESMRYVFLTELAKRHHRDAARREGELLLRLGVPGSFYTGEGFRQLAIDAFRQKDYLKAADYHERAMLRCLRPQISFFEMPAYLAVPHFVHRHRARGLVEAGRIEEALKEAEICLAAMPGNSELQSLLVPELEKRGRKQEAETLFAKCYEPHVKVCQEYPNSAWAHNGLAWLCASTRRHLDVALDHAQKAVQLEPSIPGYHDTLAEVYFQRGDTPKAIDEIKKSIALDPKRAYFKKQLKRFEAGDPKADLPPSTDEE